MVDSALKSAQKVVSRRYFFSRLKNPLWLQPLVERGCFESPPKSQRFDDGTVDFPYWPELQYLKNVCADAPQEVIEILLQLPETDNPVVYAEVIGIALRLPGKYTTKLLPKLIEYVDMQHHYRTFQYADVLVHWIKEDEVEAALELAKSLTAYAPDPQEQKKREHRKVAITEDTGRKEWVNTTLYPVPKIGGDEYSWIMSKGVRSLAEAAPYQTACLLIESTVDMIRLRTYREDYHRREDHSDLWCNFLSDRDKESRSPDEVLVHTLTFACEEVFEKSSEAIEALDEVLRDQHWRIFKRLRQHLYARYPSDRIKERIQKEILTHEGYSRSKHPYEFQLMIRSACEHFGATLLTEEESTDIFDAILQGPSKENYQQWVVRWIGREFTEEDFQKRQQQFHFEQFTPFVSLLSGKYAAYFERLKNALGRQISDEDYLPYKVESGIITNQSPCTAEDLSNLSDKALLDFINGWEKADELPEKFPFVEINVKALADEFQVVFSKSILPNTERCQFWLDNREAIERPIYVRMMVRAMQATVAEKDFDRLDVWLEFCEWVLKHSSPNIDGTIQDDTSRENPGWYYSRQSVVDFIDVCLKTDVEAPISARKHLAKLLEMLCTQFDEFLDGDRRAMSDSLDPLTQGINTTRGDALQTFVNFGFWVRRHNKTSDVSELTTLLEKRFHQQTEYPLTFPEYAVLGRHYYYISILDETWATKHKMDFFPQENLDAWAAAFGSLVDYTDPVLCMFPALQDEFQFAMQHLNVFKRHNRVGQYPILRIGQHLFTYYLWEAYPLRGEGSLIEQYYQQTKANPNDWGALFNDIGGRLSNSPDTLSQNMKDRVTAFFEWRIQQKVPIELQYFTIWFQAEGLAAEWRLDAYARVLDICEVVDRGTHLKKLAEMIPDYTAKVVECFLKLTSWIKNGNIYIDTETATTILNAGFGSSDDCVKQNASQAYENLLDTGRLDLFDVKG